MEGCVGPPPWKQSPSPLPLEDSTGVTLTSFIPFSPISHHPQLLGSTIKKAGGLGNEVRYSPMNMGNYLLIRKRKSEWQSRTSTGGFPGVMRVLISNGKSCWKECCFFNNWSSSFRLPLYLTSWSRGGERVDGERMIIRDANKMSFCKCSLQSLFLI